MSLAMAGVSVRSADAGDLIISGGGTIVVATDELLTQVAALEKLMDALADARSLVVGISDRHTPGWLVAVDAPISAMAADRAVAAAVEKIERCRRDAQWVVWMVHTAMQAYGVAEMAATQIINATAARVSYLTGALAPVLLLVVLPGMGTAAAAVLLAGLATGHTPDEVFDALRDWVQEHNDILSDPVTVELVRGMMNNTDDLLSGALHLPSDLATVLGSEGLGVLGLSTTAAIAVALGRSGGFLEERAVQVTRVTTSPTTPPESLAGRAGRIPEPVQGKPAQVRIDRYTTPGQPDRFEVYIAGTIDVGLVSGDQPWDMTSNIGAVAGASAASVASVREAMVQAGVTADSEVVFTGYSQGGLVAAQVAASGDYNVKGLVTFGAPIGGVELPSSVPVLSVRHTDDLVPTLTGHDKTLHGLVIEREVYDGVPVPSDEMLPAHSLRNYRDTAVIIDDAESTQVLEALAYLDDFAGRRNGVPTAVESTTYVGRRVGE